MINQYRREDCLKKEGAWTVCRFKVRLSNKEGVVLFFEGGWVGGGGGVDTPIHTMDIVCHKSDLLCQNYILTNFKQPCYLRI